MKTSGSNLHIKLQAVLSSAYRTGHQTLKGWFWQPQLRVFIFHNALYFFHQHISKEILMQVTYFGLHLGDASGLWQSRFLRTDCTAIVSSHFILCFFTYSWALLSACRWSQEIHPCRMLNRIHVLTLHLPEYIACEILERGDEIIKIFA